LGEVEREVGEGFMILLNRKMNMNLENYEKLNIELRSQYAKHKLQHIYEVAYEGEHSVTFFSNITGSKKRVVELRYIDFKLYHDFDFITQSLKYIVGTLYLLHPHINNTTDDGKYIQKHHDSRYLMHADYGYQAVYNFWDRIGDLLYLYFETGLDKDNVYVGRVLNNINPEHKSKKEYDDLFALYDNNVKPILDQRHGIVHYFTKASQYYWGHVEKAYDPEEQKLLNEEKLKIPDQLKQQLFYCCEAFGLTLKLLGTLPDKISIMYEIDKVSNKIISLSNLINQKDYSKDFKGKEVKDEDEIKKLLSSFLKASYDQFVLIEKPE
jgi:hypothetical protein